MAKKTKKDKKDKKDKKSQINVAEAYAPEADAPEEDTAGATEDNVEDKNKENNNESSLLNTLNAQKKKKKNVLNTSTSAPAATLIIIDNFYNNPLETRKYILQQEFNVKGNYPGQRTLSFATEEIKNILQSYVLPFGGKIIEFPMKKTEDNYNGTFQYTTSRERSWIHVDSWNNWAGVLFMTPNAPLDSGTGLYQFEDGTRFEHEHKLRKNEELINKSSQDVTKWELVDKVGNVFNRLVLFNSNHYHSSINYFGDSKETGRLFQVFFFSTEK